MLHALHADRVNRGNIVVRANGTDVGYQVRFIENSNMWYDVGIESREYLNVTKLDKSIDYADALPGIYAFTVNDYMPAFSRKGKVKPNVLMCKHETFVNTFKCSGEMALKSNVIEEYTCPLYGYTKQADIHKVIKTHFENKIKPKPSQKPLECSKSIEPKLVYRYII